MNVNPQFFSVSREVLRLYKECKLVRELRVKIPEEGRCTVTFFGNTHGESITYVVETPSGDMYIESFTHCTALYDNTLLPIIKGFVAGKGWS